MHRIVYCETSASPECVFFQCFGQLDVDAFEVDGSSAVCASLKQYGINFRCHHSHLHFLPFLNLR